MKTLSVKQPHATLICAGVKRVENRTWTTDFRGRLLIHASGDFHAYPDFNFLPKAWQAKMAVYADSGDWSEATDEMLNYSDLLERAYGFYGKDWQEQENPMDWLKQAVKERGFFMPAQAIVGEATLSSIVTDSTDDFAIPGQYHWLMTDAVLYDKPIAQVMGRLRLWDFQKTA